VLLCNEISCAKLNCYHQLGQQIPTVARRRSTQEDTVQIQRHAAIQVVELSHRYGSTRRHSLWRYFRQKSYCFSRHALDHPEFARIAESYRHHATRRCSWSCNGQGNSRETAMELQKLFHFDLGNTK